MTVQEQRWTNPLGIDFVLLGIVIILLLIGLMMVFSVTFVPLASEGAAEPQADFVHQLQAAGMGLAILIVLSQINYRRWGTWAVPLMIVTLVLLVILLFTPAVNGSRRWLFGGSIQPSEIAKFTVIVYMAKWVSSKGEKLRQATYGLLPFAIIVGVVCGLIVLQPNLSTAIIIGLCALAMFFIGGADVIQLLILGIIGGVTTAIVIANTPYQMSRFTVFISNPLALSGREGYQIVETLIALGSGGLFGRGIGSGYSKFGYVPAPQTDSIFALLGEELGLIGTWTVLALYLFLVYRGFRIAARSKDSFGQVLAAGMTFWLIFQAFVNIAVVTATIPFTGVPLPFISFGGSSLVAALAAVGVLLNISRSEPTKEADATITIGWRDRGTRVPRPDSRRRDVETNRSIVRSRR
jgi:cell division protein FtsW